MKDDDSTSADIDSMERRKVIQQSFVSRLALAGLATSLPGVAAAQSQRAMRIVVTANTAEGKSYLLKNVTELAKPGLLWTTTAEMTLGVAGPGDLAMLLPTTLPRVDPTPGGARWQISSPAMTKRKRGDPMDRTLGIDGQLGPNGMHRTRTIDYVQILSGEVTMFLDIGEVELKAGDVVIQRNTSHAWQNYSTTPCLLLAMLVYV